MKASERVISRFSNTLFPPIGIFSSPLVVSTARNRTGLQMGSRSFFHQTGMDFQNYSWLRCMEGGWSDWPPTPNRLSKPILFGVSENHGFSTLEPSCFLVFSFVFLLKTYKKVALSAVCAYCRDSTREIQAQGWQGAAQVGQIGIIPFGAISNGNGLQKYYFFDLFSSP